MSTLIQTSECSIIYGKHNGKDNQELFRCPRKLDDIDLKRYINQYREVVKYEDDETEDVREVDGKEMVAYYRMYFSNGRWYGTWIKESKEEITALDCVGVDKIIKDFSELFLGGCNLYMQEFMERNFTGYCDNKRFLLKPFMNDYYKIMVDTTYGNGDYPVRIYAYHDKEGSD